MTLRVTNVDTGTATRTYNPVTAVSSPSNGKLDAFSTSGSEQSTLPRLIPQLSPSRLWFGGRLVVAERDTNERPDKADKADKADTADKADKADKGDKSGKAEGKASGKAGSKGGSCSASVAVDKNGVRGSFESHDRDFSFEGSASRSDPSDRRK